MEVQASTRRMFWSDPWGAVINDNISVVQAELLEKAKNTTESSKKNAIISAVGGGPRQCFGVFCNTPVLKDVVHSSMSTWRQCLGVRRSISMMFWWKPFSCFDKQLVQPKIIVKLLGVESTIWSKQFQRTPALMTMMRMLVTLTEMAR